METCRCFVENLTKGGRQTQHSDTVKTLWRRVDVLPNQMRENWVIFISVDLRQEIRLGLILLYIGKYCLAKNYLFIFDG